MAVDGPANATLQHPTRNATNYFSTTPSMRRSRANRPKPEGPSPTPTDQSPERPKAVRPSPPPGKKIPQRLRSGGKNGPSDSLSAGYSSDTSALKCHVLNTRPQRRKASSGPLLGASSYSRLEDERPKPHEPVLDHGLGRHLNRASTTAVPVHIALPLSTSSSKKLVLTGCSWTASTSISPTEESPTQRPHSFPREDPLVRNKASPPAQSTDNFAKAMEGDGVAKTGRILPKSQSAKYVRWARSLVHSARSLPDGQTAEQRSAQLVLERLVRFLPGKQKTRGGKRESKRVDMLRAAVSSTGKPMFESHFRMGRVLGEGGYGCVRSCEQLSSGRLFAVKVVEKKKFSNSMQMLRARMEFQIHSLMSQHPGIVHVEDFFEDSDRMFLVMELCQDGDLFEHLSRAGKLSEHEAASLFGQVVPAVKACHEQGVLHRDLKLENLMMKVQNARSRPSATSKDSAADPDSEDEERTVLLGDFGSALLLLDGDKTSGASGGSLMYQAPEILHGHKYDFKVDMWALGVILYCLLCGKFPFTAPTDSLLAGMIKRGIFSLSGPVWDRVSDEAKDLVRNLLSVDPERRPSVQELCQHPWVLQRCRLTSNLSLEQDEIDQREFFAMSF